jgi:hypothetical protein
VVLEWWAYSSEVAVVNWSGGVGVVDMRLEKLFNLTVFTTCRVPLFVTF